MQMKVAAIISKSTTTTILWRTFKNSSLMKALRYKMTLVRKKLVAKHICSNKIAKVIAVVNEIPLHKMVL